VLAAALHLTPARPPAVAPVPPGQRAPVAAAAPVAPPPPVVPATGRRSASTASLAPAASRTVQVSIEVEPLHATVTLDGRTLTGNPWRGEVPLERRTHVVQAAAAGYATTERMMTLVEDTHVQISLVHNRAHRSRPARRDGARPDRAARARDAVVARQETAGRPEPARAEPGVEPGMELRRTAAAPRRQLDEKDPYAP
jgi:PEGA domain-containing protein